MRPLRVVVGFLFIVFAGDAALGFPRGAMTSSGMIEAAQWTEQCRWVRRDGRQKRVCQPMWIGQDHSDRHHRRQALDPTGQDSPRAEQGGASVDAPPRGDAPQREPGIDRATAGFDRAPMRGDAPPRGDPRGDAAARGDAPPRGDPPARDHFRR